VCVLAWYPLSEKISASRQHEGDLGDVGVKLATIEEALQAIDRRIDEIVRMQEASEHRESLKPDTMLEK
jgi:hypothetical protein